MARHVSRGVRLLVGVAALFSLAGVAAAHSGGLRNATQDPLTVPTWLFLLTGGGVVGASFLLASFVTDRRFIARVHAWGHRRDPPRRQVVRLARALGLLVLAATVTVGLVGPQDAPRNFAILLVWVAWWGGYVASTYLFGDTWPALNPFRSAAAALPSLNLDYPERLGAWPAVAGLLALVWIEVVSPLADDPRLLVTVVAAYGLVTVAGAVAFGTDRWFESVDPVSRVFRYYGHVAPLSRTGDGLRVRLPGAALREPGLVTGRDGVAFVVALLFVTTYDGFVGTGVWARFARWAVGVGLPPLVVYLAAYLVGFGLFYAVFHGAARLARRTGPTYLTTHAVARRFAPSLLPIAAGYHLAHNLASVLVLTPAFASVSLSPLSPPANPPVLVGLPSWFGGLELAFVLVGHLVAVWVAHATAYDLFPGRLQAVRTQYGFTLVMIAYTMVSLWIVRSPFVSPPFLG
jgi:hypothetical protein